MSLVPSPLLASTPPEILSAIVAESNAGTLVNWCGVNTTFLAEAGPLLYHTVVINTAENVMSFIELLRVFRASSPVPGSPDYQLHTFFRAVRYLDILAYPPPESLVALSDVDQPVSTTTHLELTLAETGRTNEAYDELAGFWIPRLLLALHPTILRFRDVVCGRIRETTVPPFHLAVWLPALSTLGPPPIHPDEVSMTDPHRFLTQEVGICAMEDFLVVDYCLERLDDVAYDLADSSLDVEGFRAWALTCKSHFALRPDSSVVGWASVEEMWDWHGEVAKQSSAYTKEILALPRRRGPYSRPSSTDDDDESIVEELAALKRDWHF